MIFVTYTDISYYVVQAGLKLLILLPQPLECRNYRCELPHLFWRYCPVDELSDWQRINLNEHAEFDIDMTWEKMLHAETQAVYFQDIHILLMEKISIWSLIFDAFLYWLHWLASVSSWGDDDIYLFRSLWE
jgi:hypothetical protein